MTLGEKIKNARKNAGLTQAEFAKLISNDDFKIGNTTVSNWEKNINKPDIEVISTICYKLNISADYFIEPKMPKVKPSKISDEAAEHLRKYRFLDKYGKEVVDKVLETEYERCSSETTKDYAAAFRRYYSLIEKYGLERANEIIHRELEEEGNEFKEPTLIEIKSSVYNKASAGTGFMLNDEEWEAIEIPDTPEARQADFALTISGNSMEPIYHDGDIVLVKSQPQINVGEIGIFIINDEGYIKKYGGDRLISLNDNYDDIIFSEGDSIRCSGKVIGRI